MTPKDVRYFKHHQLWTQVNGAWVRLTHRRDIERLAKNPAWDQVCYTFSKADAAHSLGTRTDSVDQVLSASDLTPIEVMLQAEPEIVERWRLDERLVNGKLSGNEHVVANIARVGAARSGGVRNVITGLLGVTPAAKDLTSWFTDNPPPHSTQAQVVRLVLAGRDVLDDAGLQSLVARIRNQTLAAPMPWMTPALLGDVSFLTRWPQQRRVSLLVDVFQRAQHSSARELLHMYKDMLLEGSPFFRTIAATSLGQLLEKQPDLLVELADDQRRNEFSMLFAAIATTRDVPPELEDTFRHSLHRLCQEPGYATTILYSPWVSDPDDVIAALEQLPNDQSFAHPRALPSPTVAPLIAEHLRHHDTRNSTHKPQLMALYGLLASDVAACEEGNGDLVVNTLTSILKSNNRQLNPQFINNRSAPRPILTQDEALRVYQLILPAINDVSAAHHTPRMIGLMSAIERALPQDNAAAENCRRALMQAAPMVRGASGFLEDVLSPYDPTNRRCVADGMHDADTIIGALRTYRAQWDEAISNGEIFRTGTTFNYRTQKQLFDSHFELLVYDAVTHAIRNDPEGEELEQIIGFYNEVHNVPSVEEYRNASNRLSGVAIQERYTNAEKVVRGFRRRHSILHDPNAHGELDGWSHPPDPYSATVTTDILRRSATVADYRYPPPYWRFIVDREQSTYNDSVDYRWRDDIHSAVTSKQVLSASSEPVEWPEKPKRFSDLPTSADMPWSVPELAEKFDGCIIEDRELGPLLCRVVRDNRHLVANASPNRMGNCTDSMATELRRGETLLLVLENSDGPLYNMSITRQTDLNDASDTPVWAIDQIAGVSNAAVDPERRKFFIRTVKRLSGGVVTSDPAFVMF